MCIRDRFYVTQQRAWGDRHLYALRSRFVPDGLLPHFEVLQAVPAATDAGNTGAHVFAPSIDLAAVSYTHLRAHETVLDLVCRLLLETKKSPTSYH